MKYWPILTVALERESDVVLARQRARRIAALVGFESQDQTRIATAVSEIARNAQTYGERGRAEFGLSGAVRAADRLVIKVTDAGPGFEAVDSVLGGTFKSDTGLGVGITGARRLMDGFELRSRAGQGVEVEMFKRLPADRAFIVDQGLGELARQLAAETGDDPVAELRTQNQELLRSLEALEARRLEAAELRDELERTNRGVVALYAEIEKKASQLQDLNATLEERVAEALARQTGVEERLRQSQKMEAVGQLTGGIAHDFNNLLMVIGGSLELLRKRVPTDAAVTRLLDAATESVARGGSLNQQLLAFARRQDLREEVICINEYADGFRRLVERAVSEDVKLLFSLGEHLWHCQTDPHQLETAILNLAINARDAMAAGGTLTLATENRTVSAEAAAVWGASPGDYVAVSIIDTGVGMSAEVVSRAFEPFFTTKEVGQGTGLGLSQVYGFATQSNGFLAVTSEPGVGTEVSIYLRRSDEPRSTVSKKSETHVASGEESILLIEDDPAVREMTSAMLSQLGYEVTTASNGQDAIHCLNLTNFDLVLSDVILPGDLSGADIAAKVAADWPDTPVLLTSGYTAQRLRLGAASAPKILIKPYNAAQLSEAVRGALNME